MKRTGPLDIFDVPGQGFSEDGLRAGGTCITIRLILFAAAMAACGVAHGQPEIPRTADGRPDFQGYCSNEFLTPVERIEGATSLIASDAEAKSLVDGILAQRSTNKFEAGIAYPEARQLARVKGEWRTSLVVDLWMLCRRLEGPSG